MRWKSSTGVLDSIVTVFHQRRVSVVWDLFHYNVNTPVSPWMFVFTPGLGLQALLGSPLFAAWGEVA